MKIIFLGLLYDKTREKEYKNKSLVPLQNAVNQFQSLLIEGIHECNVELEVVNLLPVGVYPRQYKDLYIKDKLWDYNGIQCHEIGFLNLPIVKQIDRTFKIIRTIKKIMKASKDTEFVLIAYSLYYPFLSTFRHLKNSGLKSMLIVPDLPAEYGILPKNKFIAKIYKIYGDWVIKLARSLDYYVFLTKHMKNVLKAKEGSYTIIEGIVGSFDSEVRIGKNDRKIFLYAGSLHQEFGIDKLLMAFERIDNPNIELWICGGGEMEGLVREYAHQDVRVKYFGFCDTLEVEKKRAMASVLVNPRQNNGKFTKYSFPSKTMEYLATGKPVIAYKLDGIPEEYDRYLFYVQGNEVKDLADCIEEVISFPQERLIEINKNQMAFIRTKSSRKQAKKIVDLLQENIPQY